jgi:hypothetical protein
VPHSETTFLNAKHEHAAKYCVYLDELVMSTIQVG